MEVPVEQLKLRDDRRLISPPIVAEPLYGCAKSVKIIGFLPGAALDVQVNGATVVSGFPGGFPLPNGALVPLPAALTAGQKVRARQKAGGLSSKWSTPVSVGDYSQDYPAGPPRPEINPAPVYQCGSRTGVANLLIGCDVWITSNGVEVGRVNGASDHQGVNVNPDYSLGDVVAAHARLCKDESPPSEVQIAQPPPAPLPTPGFEPIYEGGQQLTVNNLVNGAHFTLTRNTIDQGTYRTWGGRHLVNLSPPFSSGEVFQVTQELCRSAGSSAPGTAAVQPCSALPAPTVAPIQDGDTTVTCLTFVSDARIRVYLNGTKVGDSGGPAIALSQAVQDDDTIDVVQSVGTCKGRVAQELTSRCVAPPTTFDPSALDLFPVGNTDYDGGKLTLHGQDFSVRGTVYYPADNDGAGTAFNARLAGLGPVPIVFMAHGNHDPASPSHLGYDYFQKQLARMGIVAASVFLNETNGWTGGLGNIIDRADLIIAGIQHMQALSAGGDAIFGGHLDFGRVGLMGHSRGGDAVVLVPERIALPGVAIQCVIALAPTNFGASSEKPTGYAFMTILPGCDGDVIDNDGAVFYDGATPGPLKSQLYVNNANHNYFNRQWLNNDNNGGLPTMGRPDHERILSAYGCAFYRAILLGHPTAGFLLGTMLPAGVLTDNIHLSFAESSAVIVDDFEGGIPITINSMGRPNTQSAGLNANEFPFVQSGGAFNGSFFGNTTGMVVQTQSATGTFRSEWNGNFDMSQREVWLRVAEVYGGSPLPANATGFQLGLEDFRGNVAWVDSDEVGGVPRPIDRRAYDLMQWYGTDKSKTMLNTLRFSTHCFKSPRKRFDPKRVRALLLRLNRPKTVPLAFDDLQIMKK